MPFKLVETAPPAAEPVSLDEAKLHLRVTAGAEDGLVSGLVTAARMMCEAFTGLALVTRGYSLYLDSWPEGGVALPRPPLAAVSTVNVYDAGGVAAALSTGDYFADAAAKPARLLLLSGTAAPLPGREHDGIEIQYTAGYGDAAAVPSALKQGILQIVAHLYAHRGDDGDALKASGAQTLFQPFRVMGVA